MTEKSEQGYSYSALASLAYLLTGFVAAVLLSWCLEFIVYQIADFPRDVKQSNVAYGFAILAFGWIATGLLVLYRGRWSIVTGSWLGFSALATLWFFRK